MNSPTHSQSPVAYNRRLALSLFFVYLLTYGGFVAIVAIDYRLGAAKTFQDLNLAVVYGLGLILLAFVLAVAYMLLARPDVAADV